MFTSLLIKLEVLVGDAKISHATQMSRAEKLESSILLDHVGRTLSAKSCKSRDDSPNWNLSRVKQGGAIRADDMDHKTERAGRAVCHILESAR